MCGGGPGVPMKNGGPALHDSYARPPYEPSFTSTSYTPSSDSGNDGDGTNMSIEESVVGLVVWAVICLCLFLFL